MRQASWEELFKQGSGDEEAQPGFLNRLRSRFSFVSWEELVTLVIVLIGFYTVIRSIDNADWVREMPSLYGIGFIGLTLRSEEDTSELQSRSNLVCRLLLEKKNILVNH